MSFIINAELSDAVVAQGLPVYTAQQIGAVPLDPTTGKILSSYLPDQASLDLEVDQKIANNSVKFGVQWTNRHTTSTGNPYLVGSIVYNAGRVYRCIAENDSMPPQLGGNDYWADLGVGYLLPNENPSIVGGSIDTSGEGGSINTSGEAGGSINTSGSNNGGGAGGSINTSGLGIEAGGGINTSAGQSSGGSIDISDGGGSINTRGTGSIELGVDGTRTTLNGSASQNHTITLPDATGTIALKNDAHYHGDIWNTGDLQAGSIITLNININTLANGTYPVLQPLSSIFPNTNNSTAQVSVSGTAPNKVLTILNGGVGYHASMGNKSITIGGIQGTIAGYNNINKPVITNNHGFISAGSFGTTANSFCQGNDVRLGAKTVFTLGGDEKITYALGTSYVYGAHITRPSKVSGGFDQTGLYIQGNWKITGLVIMAIYSSSGTAGVTYGLVKINNASSVTPLWTAPSSNPLNNGINNVVNNTLDISLSDGDKIGFQLTIGSTAGATVPTNTNNTTILAHVYCVPR